MLDEDTDEDDWPWGAMAAMIPTSAARRITDPEAELEQTKLDKESLAVTLNDYFMC